MSAGIVLATTMRPDRIREPTPSRPRDNGFQAARERTIALCEPPATSRRAKRVTRDAPAHVRSARPTDGHSVTA